MKLELVAQPGQDYDSVVLFSKANEKVSPVCPEVKKAYEHVFPGDTLTVEHMGMHQLRLPCFGGYADVIVAGFDSSTKYVWDDFRKLLVQVGVQLKKLHPQKILLADISTLTFAEEADILCQMGMELPLWGYKFDKVLSKPSKAFEPQIDLLCASTANADALTEGVALAESVMTARDLVNEPANVLTPAELADRAADMGKRYGFEVEILEKDACEKLGMNLFMAVAAGSKLPPKLIVMRWYGGEHDAAPAALIGKGITYDSGGLAIKTSGMESMRFDMNGSAAVIGAMCAIARQKLPINVVAVVAACENAVDACSYRNGDVLTSMNGKTVFVRNTDAEGRLTMADAMTYAIRTFQPCEMIEIAGLTGSVCNFYGNVAAAALTTSQPMYDRVQRLSGMMGEKYVQMPDFPEYRSMLKTPYADINNSPVGSCGGILAGLFLASFSEDVPFLHLDLGAMPFTNSPAPGQTAGGTGFGVKTLYFYLKDKCKGQ